MKQSLENRLRELERLVRPKLNFPPLALFYNANEEARRWHLENNPTYDPDELIKDFKNLDSFYDEELEQSCGNNKTFINKYNAPLVFDTGEHEW